MTKPHSSITPSHPQSPSQRPDASRLDWNVRKPTARTSRKEWGVVQRLMFPFAGDPTGGPHNQNRPEVM